MTLITQQIEIKDFAHLEIFNPFFHHHMFLGEIEKIMWLILVSPNDQCQCLENT
jgi:hypothetical protein